MGYLNLSSTRNIVTFALQTSGVEINSLTHSQQHELVQLANALSEDLNNFDVKKPCALCGDTGHSFSGCTLTQPGVVQQNFIKLRLLANRFRCGLNDIDKQLDLNSFKNADINHLETSLLQMLNQIRVYPTHSINHSTPGSGVFLQRVLHQGVLVLCRQQIASNSTLFLEALSLLKMQ